MIPARSAFGDHQVIITVPFVYVRRFGKPEFGTAEYVIDRSDELLFLFVVLLQENAAEFVFALAVIPYHIQ